MTLSDKQVIANVILFLEEMTSTEENNVLRRAKIGDEEWQETVGKLELMESLASDRV